MVDKNENIDYFLSILKISLDSIEEDSIEEVESLFKELFPLPRSLTGDANRRSIKILQKIFSNLKIKETKSGKTVFDWKIPEEWSVKKAYLKHIDSEKIFADFNKNNLHLMSYSLPVNFVADLKDLKNKIYTIPTMPDAIPYRTSYYNKDWAFCMAHNELESMPEGDYQVLIDSKFFKGSMTSADCLIRGKNKEEIFINSYICHPSMANNELSGPILFSLMGRWISSINNLRYSYRFSLAPETIGAINYIHDNFDSLKNNVICGLNLTCTADMGNISLMPTPYNNTYADKIVERVLSEYVGEYKKYSFLERGSDERQYCSPLLDLPMVSVMRTKYEDYKEYHTSLDNLDFVSSRKLLESLIIHMKIIAMFELDFKPRLKTICEPMMGKRGLYSLIGGESINKNIKDVMNFIAYSNGENSLIDISEICKLSIDKTVEIMSLLLKKEVIDVYT